jgi:hypothetical protein
MSIVSMRCPGSTGPSPATGGLFTDAGVWLVTWGLILSEKYGAKIELQLVFRRGYLNYSRAAIPSFQRLPKSLGLRLLEGVSAVVLFTRIDTARATYDRQTHGRRQYRRDQDSKYLLTGFGRCALCGGGLHVRSRSHGKRRVFFYACTAHYNKGPAVCPHVDLWPMEELDQEVLATITGNVLTPDLVEEVIVAAREMFDGSKNIDRRDHSDASSPRSNVSKRASPMRS